MSINLYAVKKTPHSLTYALVSAGGARANATRNLEQLRDECDTGPLRTYLSRFTDATCTVLNPQGGTPTALRIYTLATILDSVPEVQLVPMPATIRFVANVGLVFYDSTVVPVGSLGACEVELRYIHSLKQ